MKGISFSVITLLFLGHINGDAVSELGERLQDNLGSALPPGITNLTQNFNPEDAEKLLMEKCRKNTGSDEAYENAKKAAEHAKTCVSEIIDLEVIQEEMEKARPTGDLDLVFKKYCDKAPSLKKCIFDLTDAYEPCLEEKERETKRTAHNVTESLLEFICHRNGDRIALFIAEGGPKCLNESQAEIKTCLETTFNRKLEDETPSFESLPLLLLSDEECQKFTDLQQCVAVRLEQCAETTPANVVDSLFNFIRQKTPCKDYESTQDKAKKTRSAAGALNAGFIFVMSAILALTITY